MKIAVVGTGYVGLVVGTCFAETGNRVTCVDVNEQKIQMLKNGQVPIYEPGLEELIARNVAEGRLYFGTDIEDAVRNAKVVFIAVGTPQGDDGSADLTHVLAVGTNFKVRDLIRSLTKEDFDVVSNPEFLKEGAAIDDFMKPDRVVIGSDSPRAIQVIQELYGSFVRTGKPILVMDVLSAEMTKYAANAMLATRISFMNEMARICEAVGADVNEVRKGIGTDSRIGHPFLFAGCGYGGSCFPKDVRALVNTAMAHGYEPKIVTAVEAVNDDQKRLLFEKVQRHFGRKLEGRHFAVWGLAFKPKTDDMREAPSLVVIERLLEGGATVTAFDPEAMHETRKILGDRIQYAESAQAALAGADALILVTEWNEFRHADAEEMKKALKAPVVFDGRNIFQPARMRELGFSYYGIGTR
jgi:UDPglucose 6-dehydrogenase